MDVFRTPDQRFAHLPDFPWEPRYATVEGLRVGYIDQGEGPAVLLMHGEPSWSFLYRKMIPPLLEAGMRVLAPDLVGFGRSDKPTDPEAYTYQSAVDWMSGWLDATGVADITFFGQDWGGLIGLRLVAGDPDRFGAVAVANTGLPTGDHAMSDAFTAWQTFARTAPSFDVGRVVQNGTVTDLPAGVVAAYDAPFPTEESKVAARVFPGLVPTTPDDPASRPNRQAWSVLSRWDKPFLCLFSDSDPITAGGERAFLRRIPGTEGQPHQTIEGAGHFLQEDAGEDFGTVLARWITVCRHG
ncbi:MAG: haloalkane dehalogenase [Acidimicrobiia bacterium]